MNDTLSLIFEWGFVDSAMDPHHDFTASAVPGALLKQGIKWLEIPVPFGKYRLPVEDDAEFLLESYRDLESLYKSDREDGKVDCFLDDGGLQYRWTKIGNIFETSLMIVPYLNGRLAQDMTMSSMDAEWHMHAWRQIVAPLCAAVR